LGGIFADDADEEVFEGGGGVGDFDGGGAGAGEVLLEVGDLGGGEAGGLELGDIAALDEFADFVFDHFFAAEEDGDAVADVLDVGKEVGAEEDGFALVFEGDDEVFHFAGADGVEAGGGFVEEDEVGVVDEGLGETDASGHAFGVFAEFALAGFFVEADGIEEGGDAAAEFFAGDFEESAVEVEGFFAVEEAVEVGFFGEEADAFVDDGGTGGFAKDGGGASGGEDEAEEEFDGGGLAGAIGAEEAEDFTAMDGEVKVVQGADFVAAPEVFVDLGEILCMNGVIV
jgi:hypothetical protein